MAEVKKISAEITQLGIDYLAAPEDTVEEDELHDQFLARCADAELDPSETLQKIGDEQRAQEERDRAMKPGTKALLRGTVQGAVISCLKAAITAAESGDIQRAEFWMKNAQDRINAGRGGKAQ